jgi:hypothetical protein
VPSESMRSITRFRDKAHHAMVYIGEERDGQKILSTGGNTSLSHWQRSTLDIVPYSIACTSVIVQGCRCKCFFSTACALPYETPACCDNLRTQILRMKRCYYLYRKFTVPRVEAGKNTSTVIPSSRKRRQKGNPVVSSETVPADLREG